ncbi:MAG: ABC transporter ATP-binding protein [Pasteurellaceae bacterium]|nr:ABC transporter ATP-binding protein [Pasteurellaceae bacterium]
MLQVFNLSHIYTGSTEYSLQNINLHIQPGEAIGLLGPNGAGKTTLMSLLTGLQAVQSGEILFEGVPFEQLSKSQRHQISLVPQDFAFYPLLSVWENLTFFAALYHLKDKAHLENLLEKTGLQDHRYKLAKHLSGGLKRRLNFAIGLINRPKVIFLDEITVGIDPASRQFILESVAALTRQGITVVYTSHYLQEIEQLCQRLVLLNQGELIYQGEIQPLIAQHHSLERFYLDFLDKQVGKTC